MSKHQKKDQVSEKTKEDSVALARGIQKPGQTKEQTKLIAQGIEKGINIYKKQHKAKLRQQSKAKKKAASQQEPAVEDTAVEVKSSNLPWVLLVLSWLFFIGFVMVDIYWV